MSKRRNKNNAQRTAPIRPTAGTTVLYTAGDDLLSAADYKRNFDRNLERAVSGQINLSDETLSRALAGASTAYACIEKRATIAGSIPLKVCDPDGNTVPDSPLDWFVKNAAPNILADITRSSLLWGRDYLRKRYNPNRWATSIEYVNPLLVTEIPDRDGRVGAYDIITLNVWGYHTQIDRVMVNEVVYWEMFDARPENNGLSKFEVAFRSIGVEQGIATHAAAFFVNGARIDGFLSFDRPLSEDETKDAKAEWRAFKGARNAHKTAVMPGGAKWNPVTAVNKDLAMAELDQIQVNKIHAVFEVDPALTGMKDVADPLSANSTFSAIEVSHIRNVTLPFLNMYVLPALNQQWAYLDFERPNYYTLRVDEANIGALAEANLLRSETAINLSSGAILDYNEGRKLLGYEPREDYIRRDPTHLSLLWKDGAITLNQYLTMMGLQPVWGGDVRLIEGKPIPAHRLFEVANKNADLNGQFMTTPFGLLPNVPVPPRPPDGGLTPQPEIKVDPVPSPALPEPARSSNPEAYAVLSLADDPQLVALQNLLKTQMSMNDQIQWTDAADFHITVFHAPLVSDDLLRQAITQVGELPTLMLKTGALTTFKKSPPQPVILPIEPDEALSKFQAVLVKVLAGLGVEVSEYSQPDAYKPHVTLAFVQTEMVIPTLDVSLTLSPKSLVFSRETHEAVQTLPMSAASVRSKPMGMEVAVDFADNQFARYARRALSEALTAQGVTADWVDEARWRLTLARADHWTPAAVAGMLRRVEYGDTRKVDLRTGGFKVIGSDIYLDITGDLAALQQAVLLDLQGVGLQATDPGVTGILLCRAQSSVNPDVLPRTDYPLVANNVSMYLFGEPKHRWSLRAVAPAQVRELQNWEHVVRRKGRDHAFTVEALAGTSTSCFVADALAAEVEFNQIFQIANDLLRGLLTWRNYPETRDQFVNELVEIISAGQANDIDRRNFAARMRVVLRRLGLQAFRDGFNAGGADPEGYTPDQLAAFRGWQEEASGYVTKFGSEMFGHGISEGEIRLRAEMWANKSLRDIFLIGEKLAAPLKKKRWRRDPAKESCETCIKLDGVVRTLEEWHNTILPGSFALECHGFQCGCDLENVE